MIKKIQVQKVATFDNLVELLPKKINFIYGSNGSGKTTISNLIGGYINSEDCLVDNDNMTKVLVYNRNFVEENFSQSVKGIFTLGEDSIHAQEELERLRKENQNKLMTIDTKKETLKGFHEDIESQKKATNEKCWGIQQNIGNSFSEALIGYRNSKQKFFEKCIAVFDNWDKAKTEDIETIKSKYQIAYSKNSEVYPSFPIVDISQIDIIEKSVLLEKVITGSNDTPFGQFIELLKNSDWVKKGLEYTNISNDKCPFCQQTLSDELQKEVENFFDKEYENDCEELDMFIEKYTVYFDNISKLIFDITETQIPFISTENLKSDYKLFDKQFELNINELKKSKSLHLPKSF